MSQHNVHSLHKAIFDGYFSRILHVVSKALAQTKNFVFDVGYLQSENPSYRERADMLVGVHGDMMKVASALGFEYQTEVIGEYISLMREMADAIDGDNQEKLQRVISELDKKPFIIP